MNILYFSQVPWSWIKQRPHFLPEALSKLGHDVTFFSIATGKQKSNFKDGNFKVKEIRGLRGSAKLNISRKVNAIICKKAFKNDNYEIVILTYPFQYNYLTETLKRKPILYDCMDIVPDFYTGNSKSFMETSELNLSNKAIKIITSSNAIAERIQRKYGISSDKFCLIRNAVVNNIDKRTSNHNVMLNENNAVYVGTIDSWIDFETLYQYCIENKDFYIYMVGPISGAVKKIVLKAPPNIVFTGALGHNIALEYVKKAKIVLIPFIVTDLIKGVDPVKLYEYIALGKSIVSSYWEELKHFNNEQIVFYDEKASFAEAIQKAKYIRVKKSDFFIIKNNWDDRSRRLDAIIKQIKPLN